MINDEERSRFWELDFIRGICILLMVIDHFLFAAAYVLPSAWEWCGTDFFTGLNEFALNYWDNFAHSIAHYVVVTLFMLVCGISCTLSRSNLSRGLKAAGVALLITLITWLGDSFFDMDGSFIITFGVIHMYAIAILLYHILSLPSRLTKNKRLADILKFLPAAIGTIGLIVFFVKWGGFEVLTGYNFNRYVSLMPKTSHNGNKASRIFISMIIEIKNERIKSADYFPIIPYAFLIFMGSIIGFLFYHSKRKNALKPLEGKWNKPISFLGRHTLFIYLIHQIVFVALFYCIASLYYIF